MSIEEIKSTEKIESTELDINKMKSIEMQSYKDVVEIASIPASKRENLLLGRNGEKKPPRKYHMTSKQLCKIVNNMYKNGRIVPPYRKGGSYWGIIESLISLGTDKKHLFADFMSNIEKVMNSPDTCLSGSNDTSWERFNSRKPRSATGARDIIAKLVENIEVLQRLHGMNPYGIKLLQIGAVINLYEDTEAGNIYIELSTNNSEPVNPINTRRNQRSKKDVDITGLGIPYCIMDNSEKEKLVIKCSNIDENLINKEILEEVIISENG